MIPASATDATSSTKGVIQLAGDLGGTAALPTVPGLAGKEPTVTAGTTAQYYRGDKTWQTFSKGALGLANVDNTSDANKPISTATQTALDTKLTASATDATIAALVQNYASSTGSTLSKTYARGVSIKEYGATTGSADNAAAIQSAIDAVATDGGGVIFIPRGTWITGPIVMKTGVTVAGEGYNSILKLKNGSNAHMFTLATASEKWTGFRDVRLDGNKANQTSGDIIHYDQTGYTSSDTTTLLVADPNHYLHRVVLINAKGHGFYHYSDSNGACQLIDVVSYGNDNTAFYIASPDNQLDHCIGAGSGQQGFNISGNQNRLLGCKAFINGQITASNGVGFLVSGGRNDLIHCEAQDNRNHGFSLVALADAIVIVKSERNGLGAGGNPTGGVGDGMYAQAVTNSHIVLNATDRLVSSTAMQRWGYNLGAGNDGNIVQITGGANSTGTAGIGSWGPNSIVTEVFQGKMVARPIAPSAATSQSGTTYTAVMADAGTVVEMNNAAASTFTIPPNSSVAFPIGTVIEVDQMGAGQVTLAAGAGVTLRSRGGAYKLTAQYSVASLRKRADDEWVVVGDLTP